MTPSESSTLLMAAGALNDIAEKSTEATAKQIREVQATIEEIAIKYLPAEKKRK